MPPSSSWSGGLVGRYSEAREHDLASRREANRELELRAGELERSNEQLGQAVQRLEAFAEIARSVGGETDVQRVLDLILEHGRGVVDARSVVIHLRDSDEMRDPRLARVLESGAPARFESAVGRAASVPGRTAGRARGA